ncbi:MAG: LuxR C-terminal-related transcriptional regulator [Anaerolineae bacterium]
MDMSLLPTKLYIPPPRPNLVLRYRLLDRLDEGLRLGRQLSLVSAPAGFGKTTLATTWLYATGRPISSRAVAWLSLDEGDNDPVRLIVHLIAALRQIDGAIGHTAHGMLKAPQLPPVDALMTSLIADLAAVATPLVLVLDDYHLIQASEIHALFDFLLEHQPVQMHLMLLSREAPPLPLPRLRARGQVTEIGAADLRFTYDEAVDFLEQTMKLPTNAERAASMVKRTEGWIAGLQLLALTGQRAEGLDPETLKRKETLGNRYVVDYLVSEVLQQQPQRIQSFLRATCILDRLTAPLCNAVTGRLDAGARLKELDDANLFLIPLDEQGAWYRYYRLFAEALQSTLSKEEQGTLHHRAMTWYEGQGLAEPAMRHALARAELTDDLDDVARLVRGAAEPTVRRGEVMTVRNWLELLPNKRIRSDGLLATYKGWVLALTGDLMGSGQYADVAEARYRALSPGRIREDPTLRTNLGKLRALRSFIVLLAEESYPKAIRLSDDALAMLPDRPDLAQWRILALWAKAESLERTHRVGETIETLREAQRIAHETQETLFAVFAEVGMAKSLNDLGRRRDALAVCESAISRYADASGTPLPLVGFVYTQLGMLAYEANEIDVARRYHETGIGLSEKLGLKYELVYSRALAAPTLYAQGETESALEFLRVGHRLATEKGYADADWFLSWQVNIRLWEGDFVFARHWVEHQELSPHDPPQLLRIEQHLTYARVLLAQRRISEARRWLARLTEFTQAHGLYRWLLSVYILQAWTSDWSGDRDAARDLLGRALQTAAPEGYVRAFLHEGSRVIKLLPDLRAVAPAFVDRISAAAEESDQGSPAILGARPEALIEPLTDREREVMNLIASGLSNQEIADELIIAIGTVKRHINHIYGKLQVHRRTEAVARARELGLLS